MTRQNAPTCDDCYFRRHGLCAMTPERPCPTFRAATRTLQPPRQPRLVPLAVVAVRGRVARRRGRRRTPARLPPAEEGRRTFQPGSGPGWS